MNHNLKSLFRFDPESAKILDSTAFPSSLHQHHGGALTTYLSKPLMIAGSNGMGVEHLSYGAWIDFDPLPGKGHRSGHSAVNLHGSVFVFGGQERTVSRVCSLVY